MPVAGRPGYVFTRFANSSSLKPTCFAQRGSAVRRASSKVEGPPRNALRIATAVALAQATLGRRQGGARRLHGQRGSPRQPQSAAGFRSRHRASPFIEEVHAPHGLHALVREPPLNHLVGVGRVVLPGHGDVPVVAETEGTPVNVYPVGLDEGHAPGYPAEPVTDLP